MPVPILLLHLPLVLGTHDTGDKMTCGMPDTAVYGASDRWRGVIQFYD